MIEEGPLKNGKRDGSWKGSNKETASTFKEEYSNGRLISGTAVCNGANYNYTDKRYTGSMFPGGDAAFARFLARQIRYPDYERDHSIQGNVILSFEVEKDGKLSNFQVVQLISNGLDQEALRVIKTSPKWTASTLYGVPQKVRHTVSIRFALNSM